MVVGAVTVGESGAAINQPPHFAELCSKWRDSNNLQFRGQYASERSSSSSPEPKPARSAGKANNPQVVTVPNSAPPPEVVPLRPA